MEERRFLIKKKKKQEEKKRNERQSCGARCISLEIQGNLRANNSERLSVGEEFVLGNRGFVYFHPFFLLFLSRRVSSRTMEIATADQ